MKQWNDVERKEKEKHGKMERKEKYQRPDENADKIESDEWEGARSEALVGKLASRRQLDGRRITDGGGNEITDEHRKVVTNATTNAMSSAVEHRCGSDAEQVFDELTVVRYKVKICTVNGKNEAEGYQQRWHVSDVLGLINVVQSEMQIVWQLVEESDTYIWKPPWSLC